MTARPLDQPRPTVLHRPADPRPIVAPRPIAHPRPIRTWPSALAALSVPNYRLWLSSQMIATTALWMQRIAQDWLVLELSGSVAAVGLAVALQFLPVLIFGLVGGVIADRFPKRVLLLITQSSAAALALTLGLLTLSGTTQIWHVYVIAALLGLVTVVDNPTRQVFVSELVGDRLLSNAVSLNSSVFQFGALVGPALTGVLIAAVGQGWAFMINSAACLLVVVMVLIIRPGRAAGEQRSGRAGRLREGLRYIRSTSEVAWTIGLVATAGVLGLNLPVLLTAFADQEFSVGVGGYSLFNSLNAAGALTGALLSARRSRAPRLRYLTAVLTTFGLVILVAAWAPWPWLFGAALVLGGGLTLLFLTGANALVQSSAGAHLRGRVMSVYILVLLGGQAIGGPLVGLLTDHAGARVSMALCGGLITAVTLACGITMARRSHLTLAVDLHRHRSSPPIQILHS